MHASFLEISKAPACDGIFDLHLAGSHQPPEVPLIRRALGLTLLTRYRLSAQPVQYPHQQPFSEMNGILGAYLLTTIAANTAIIIKVDFLGFKLYGLGRAKLHTFATPRTGIPFLSGL